MKPTDYDHNFDTTILGGMPVVVGFNIAPPEPDIGHPGGVEDITIFTRKGGYARWAESRLDPNGWMDLEDECNERRGDRRDDFGEARYDQRRDDLLEAGR